MTIYNDIERYIETRAVIICNTFRDKEKIKSILKDSITSGNVEPLTILSKGIGNIANDISDIHKLTKQIDDEYKEAFDKIIDNK